MTERDKLLNEYKGMPMKGMGDEHKGDITILTRAAALIVGAAGVLNASRY